MQKQNTAIRRMVVAAMIAAAYCAISICLLPLSFGVVQVRVSEALTLLPVLSPAAIWGVSLGCALTNAIGFATGANIIGMLDIFFGTAATLTAAWLSWVLRGVRFHGLPVLSSLPPVLLNAVVIGGELTFVIAGGFNWKIFLINALQVGGGQLLSCCVIGLLLVWALERKGLDRKLFRNL